MWTMIRRSSNGSLLSETSAETNNDVDVDIDIEFGLSSNHPYYQSKLIYFQKYKLLLLMLLKSYIVKNFYFILIELCIFMRIFVWTGSSQCFMTQCTTETACLTPGVTMQGYKSQKCEISINHNLTRPAKQWIARQIIGILTRTKHGSHATISVCCLPDHLLSRDPWWPRYGQVTCAPSPLSPLLIITNPRPGDHWGLSAERKWNYQQLCWVK